jgi:hypothetical protein
MYLLNSWYVTLMMLLQICTVPVSNSRLSSLVMEKEINFDHLTYNYRKFIDVYHKENLS